MKFFNESYCIRCTKDLGIYINDKRKIKKLYDINPKKGSTKYFYNIRLTTQEYVCKAQESEDIWFIGNNISEPYVIRKYIKRFNIKEMFRNFKSSGFNLEDT